MKCKGCYRESNVPFSLILESVRPLRYTKATASVVFPLTKVRLRDLSIAQFVLAHEACVTVRVQGASLRMSHSRVARLGARRAQVRAGATDRAYSTAVDIARTALLFDLETL